ncbi:MAG: YdcH family protein [Alphaproteobacteria bacterium]|nr:YdcH family protein [Alphaproteobacteria bacterium]
MEEDKLLKELDELKREHRELDQLIQTLDKDPQRCLFTIQRHKKRKLTLKDQIAYLECFLYPDLIA